MDVGPRTLTELPVVVDGPSLASLQLACAYSLRPLLMHLIRMWNSHVTHALLEFIKCTGSSAHESLRSLQSKIQDSSSHASNEIGSQDDRAICDFRGQATSRGHWVFGILTKCLVPLPVRYNAMTLRGSNEVALVLCIKRCFHWNRCRHD